MADWLLPLLRCPVCGESLAFESIDGSNAQGVLHHQAGSCAERYAVIDGIQRVVVGAARGVLLRAPHEWFAQPQASSFLAEGSRAVASHPVCAAVDDEWAR